MGKKKSKSNTVFIVAAFLIVLGIVMAYYSSVSGDKGLVASAVFSIIIGASLVYVTRRSARRRRR